MKPILLVVIFCAAVALPGLSCSKQQAKAEGAAVQAAKTTTVYYFHRTIRCPSCNKIEALAKQAVELGFAGDLAAGAMTWHVVNIDTPVDAHFEKDYQLKFQSVVVSEVRNGKEIRWKNLDKVWDLLTDDAAFIQYVQEEIRTFEQEN